MALVLSIQLQANDVRVRLRNPGDGPIRVWQLGNSWGGDAWSLRLTGPGGRALVLRPSRQAYTRNVPRSLEIPAHGQREIQLAPSQPTWAADGDLAPLKDAPLEVQAVLEIAPSKEAGEQGVATGRFESAPVTSRPPHGWLFGPPRR